MFITLMTKALFLSGLRMFYSTYSKNILVEYTIWFTFYSVSQKMFRAVNVIFHQLEYCCSAYGSFMRNQTACFVYEGELALCLRESSLFVKSCTAGCRQTRQCLCSCMNRNELCDCVFNIIFASPKLVFWLLQKLLQNDLNQSHHWKGKNH